MGTVLDMNIGKNPHVAGVQPSPIARCRTGAAVKEAFIGDIGVGPLINPDEGGPCRLGHRQRLDRAIGSTFTPTGNPDARRTASVITAMQAAVSGPSSSGLTKGISP